MKRSNLYFVIMVCIIVGLSLTIIDYCTSASVGVDMVKQIRRVVRKAGWNVPGVSQSSVTSEIQSISIDEKMVTKKKLKSETELLATEEFFYVKDDGQLQINSIQFALRGLYCYELAGEKFAYEVRLVPVQVKDNGTRVYTGAMIILYYFDEDGDGIFEARYSDLLRIKLPEWIKKRESTKE